MNNAHFEPAAIVWAQVWQVTLVALVLGLAARFGCRRRPHLAYLLWMLVVLKALTPPLVASPTGLFSWALRVESPAPNVPEPLQVVREPALPRQIPVTLVPDEPTAFVAGPRPAPAPQEPELVSRVSLAGLLLAIWLAGAVALAVYAVFKWRTCRRSWSAGAMPVPTALEQGMRGLAERLGIRPGVCGRMRLLVSRNAASPAVFGVWRPTVLLPAAVVERDGAAPVGLEPILAHELVHVRRGDTTAALLQLVAQLIWWFHPLMWWANREARRERERACDEEVITGLGCSARDYARALLDVLEQQSRPQPAFAVPGVGMLGVTARRLEHLLRPSPHFHTRTPWSYYAIATVVFVLVLPGAGLKIAAAPPAPKEREAADPQLGSPGGTRGQTPTSPSSSADAKAATDGSAEKRLGDLGAAVRAGSDSAGVLHVSVLIGDKWKGTDADVALLNDLPVLSNVFLDLHRVGPTAVSGLKPNGRLGSLTLDKVDDATLANVTHLPDVKTLNLSDSSVSTEGARRIAELAPDVESLRLEGSRPTRDDKGPPTAFPDAVLKHVGQLRRLRSLDLFNVALTDEGLQELAGLDRLELLTIDNAPGIRGSGLAQLKPLSALRRLVLVETPLDAEGLKALAHLTQLRSLVLHPVEFQPDDAAAIGKLVNLRSLTVTDTWSSQDGFKKAAVGDALLQMAATLPALETLSLGGLGTTDAGAEALAAAPTLTSLALHPVRVTDRSLAAVGRLKELRKLRLHDDGDYTAVGLTSLATLKQLRQLELPGDRITDEMLRPLAGLDALESLKLVNSNVTGAGLSALAPLKKLQTLALENAKLNDRGCRALADLAQLRSLDVSDSQIGNKALDSIAKLAKLQSLSLSRTAVTGSGLARLAGLAQLREISLDRIKLSKEARDQLIAAHPGIMISGLDWNAGDDTVTYSLEVDKDARLQDATDDATEDVNSKALGKEDAGAGNESSLPTRREDDSPAHVDNPRTDKESQALERLHELGALVIDRPNAKGERQVLVTVGMQWKGTVADLGLLADVPALTSLHCGFKGVAPVALAALKFARPVESLTLADVTDDALENLPRLPACRNLILADSDLTDAGAKRLAELASGVESLQINGGDLMSNKTRIGILDAGVKHLASLKQLKRLNLLNVAISDAGLKSIAQLDNLESLSFSHCPNIRGTAFGDLADLAKLRSLRMHGGKLEAEAFRSISELRQLDRLDISLGESKKLQPADVKPLSQMIGLRVLNVSESSALTDSDPIPHAPADVALGKALLGIAGKLPNLQTLNLFGMVMDDEGLAALASQAGGAAAEGGNGSVAIAERGPPLRYLGLYPITVTDAGLASLSRIGTLRQLNLTGEATLTADGLASLSRLNRLAYLTIPAASVTDDMFARLAPLKGLKGLALTGAKKFTGRGLAALKDVPRLRALGLDNSALDDEGSQGLTNLVQLEALQVGRTKITDRALVNIGKLTRLRALALDGTAVTDAGLAQLGALKQLNDLDLDGTSVSEAGKEKLDAAVPGLHLARTDPGATPRFSARSSLMQLMQAIDQIDENDADQPAVKRDRGDPPVSTPANKSGRAEPKDGGDTSTLTKPTIIFAERPFESPAAEGPKTPSTFSSSAAEPRETTEGQKADAATAQRALKRLKELGATPASLKQIGIQDGWKGTDADVSLVNDLPDLKWLHVDLERHVGVGVEAIGTLQLKRPVEALILAGVSDDILAKLERLPKCRTLLLPGYKLSDEGFGRLARLAEGIERLELMHGISDEGLRYVGQIRSLKGLRLYEAGITDAGLAHLAALDKLEGLELAECWKVRWPGYASLAPIKSLRQLTVFAMQIDSEALQALAKLTQLTSLKIQPLEEPSKEDVDRLRAALASVEISIVPYNGVETGFFLAEGGDVDAERAQSQAAPARGAMAGALVNEAGIWMARRQYSRAKDHFEEALRLSRATGDVPNLVACNFAWFLATCPDDKFRDGPRAAALAKRACEGLRWKNPEAIDTLAAASAEAGDFHAAMKWEMEAIKLAAGDDEFRKGADERLTLYKQMKPYRESPRQP